MTILLETKQKIKNFYGEHDTWLLPLLKFLLAFLVFQSTNFVTYQCSIADQRYDGTGMHCYCGSLLWSRN